MFYVSKYTRTKYKIISRELLEEKFFNFNKYIYRKIPYNAIFL